MSVRAKFKVTKTIQSTSGSEVLLEPVTSGSAENELFFRHTPFGAIHLGILSFAASERFTPGQEFYVDFTSCEPE